MNDIVTRDWLGGSDIAAVCGLSPWKTPLQVYEQKRRALAGEAEQDIDSAPKRRGRLWESAALEMLVEALAKRDIQADVVETNQRTTDLSLPWMRAEVDAVLDVNTGAFWNAEIKTVSPFNTREWGDIETDEIPTHYAAQCQWGLMITGRSVCVVGCLIGADVMKPYIIERDEAVIGWLREQAIEFWNHHVLPGIPPAPVNLNDLAMLYPRERDAMVVADDMLTEQVLRYRAIVAEINARERERDALEFAIKREMGDAAVLAIGVDQKPAFTWKTEERAQLDYDKLKNEYPTVYKACSGKRSSRVFRYKNPGMEGVIS